MGKRSNEADDLKRAPWAFRRGSRIRVRVVEPMDVVRCIEPGSLGVVVKTAVRVEKLTVFAPLVKFDSGVEAFVSLDQAEAAP